MAWIKENEKKNDMNWMGNQCVSICEGDIIAKKKEKKEKKCSLKKGGWYEV